MNRLGNLPELNGLLDEFQPDSTIQDEQTVFRKQQSRKRTLDVRGLGDGETLAPELPEYARPATLGDSLYDFGSNVISSGEQTLSAVSGLADIATGGASRYAQEALGKGLDVLGESVGFNQRKAFSDFNKKLFTEKTRKQRENISSAESFTDALKAIYNNPRGAVTLAGDTILPMMAGGVLGNLAKASGFVKTGTAAGALGEGAISAGLSLENMVNQREARRAQISDYLNSLGIGLATGMVGVAGGKLANKAGVTDVDAAIANGALRSSTNKGLVQKATAPLIAGAIEGGEEAAQSVFETILTNASLNKPLTEGLGANVATGAALGTAMGSTFNLVTPLITKNDKGEALDPTTSTPYSDKRVSKVASKINSLLERKVELASQGLDTSAIDEHIERLKTGLANTKPENKPEVSQEIDTVTEYVDHVNNAIDSVKSINEAVSKESQLKELVKADKPGLTDDQAAQIAHNILNRTLYNTSKNKDDSEDVFKIVYADELVKSESPDYFKSEEDIDNEIEAAKQVENEVKIVNRVPKPEDAQSSVETVTEAPQSPVEPQTSQTNNETPVETNQPVEEPVETVTNEQPQQEQNVAEDVDIPSSVQETPIEAPQSPVEPQTSQTNTETPVETNQPVEAPVEPKSKPKKSPKKPKSKKAKEKFEAIKAELEAIASATEEASPEVKGLTKQVEDIAEKASEDVSLKDLSNDELKSELNNKESEYKPSDLKQEALNRINNGSLSFDDISGTDVFTVKEDTPLKKITKNTKSNSSKTTPKRKIRKLNAIIKELSNLDKNISTEIIDTLIENADGLVTKPRGIKLQKQTIAAQLKDFLNALKININNNNDLKTFFDEQESLDPLSKKQFVTVFNKAFNQQLISLDGSVNDNNSDVAQDTTVSGSTVEDVKKWIPKKVLESGIIEVVQSIKDLPAHLQSSGNILKSVVAWHGSPHDHNKFSTKHIGSGEGAQAFGYGLYFTDKKEIAEWYRDKLSSRINNQSNTNRIIYYKGEKLNPLNDSNPEKIAAYYIGEYGRDFAKDVLKADNENDAVKYVDKIKDEDISIKKIGRLYKVELAPEEDEYLLWDKKLSEQSDKIKKILNIGNKNSHDEYDKYREYLLNKYNGNITLLSKEEREKYLGLLRKANPNYNTELMGAHENTPGYTFYNELFDNPKKTSEYLHSLGIRGIKYLDGPSRSNNEGNYNYVIFDDSDVSIKEKYSKGLSGAEGVYDPSTNKIYLIADMLTKDNINSVLAHELLHAKINSDPKLKKQLESIKAGLRDVFNEIKSGTYKGKYADVYYKAFQRVKNADTNVQDEFEEFLAYSVSEFNQDSKNIPSGLKKLVAKIISLIKVTLTRYGLPVSNLTPNDLTTLAMQAISSNNKKVTVSELSNEELIETIKNYPKDSYSDELLSEISNRLFDNKITIDDINQTEFYKSLPVKKRIPINEVDFLSNGADNKYLKQLLNKNKVNYDIELLEKEAIKRINNGTADYSFFANTKVFKNNPSLIKRISNKKNLLTSLNSPKIRRFDVIVDMFKTLTDEDASNILSTIYDNMDKIFNPSNGARKVSTAQIKKFRDEILQIKRDSSKYQTSIYKSLEISSASDSFKRMFTSAFNKAFNQQLIFLEYNNISNDLINLSNEELLKIATELPENIDINQISSELTKRISKGEITPKDLENYTNKVSNIEEKPLQKIVNQTAKTNVAEIEAGKDTLSEPVPIVKRTADIINAEIDELNNKIDDLEDKISIEGSSPKIDRLLTKYTNKVRSLMRELHGVTDVEAPDVPVDINEVFLDDSIPEIEEASYDDFSDDVLLKDTDDDISMSLSNDIRFNIGELSKSSSDIIEKLSKEDVVNKTIRLKKDLKKADVPQEDIDLITRILSKLDPKNKGKYSWDTLIRAIEDNVKIESHADKVGAINHIEERLNKKALTETINGVAKQLEIVTVENYSDIEEDRVRDVLEKNSVKGAYDRFNNKIYIITSRHKSVKETVQTLSHELIGHLGVRKVLGERVYNFYARILRSDKTLLNDVIQLVPRYSVYIERWSKKEGNNIDDLDPKEVLTVKHDGKTIKIPFEVGLRLADEYVARIAEKEVFYSSFIKDEVGLSKSKRKSLAKKRSKFLSKVVAKITHFFRTRAGKQSQYLTKDDIKKALAESVNHIFKQTNFDYTRLISEADYLKLSAQTVEGLTSDAELEAVNMQIRASFLAKRAAIEAGAVSDDIAKTISLMISSDGYQIKKSAYTKRLDRIGGKIRRNKVLAPFFATGALNHAKYLSIIESRASGLYTDIQQLSRRFRKLSAKMNDKATHEAYLYFTNKDAEVPDVPLINNPKLDAELKQLLPQAKNAITELGSKLVGLGGLNSETYLANKDEYLPTMYVKYLDTYQGSKLKPSFRNYLKEKNKDYSELDREMMGQIKDPTFLVYNALNVISRDVALHQMYDAIYKASADSNLKWVLGDKDFIEDRYGNKITPMAIRDKIEYLKDLINIHETASKKRAVNFSVGTYESLKEELSYYERINEEYNQSVREDVRRIVRSTENRDVTEDDIDAFLNKNYIKMPDNRRFGSLAGQYVRKEVHDTFFNIDEAMEYISNPKDGGRKAKQILRNIHAGFKGIKVGINPSSHIRNGISNFVHLDMGTNTNTLLLMGYTKSVLSDLYRGKSNRFIDYAYKSGLSSTTFSTNELSRFADSYSQFLKAAETKNPIYKIFPYMSGAFAKMMEFTSHIYGLNEMIFKTAALQDQVLIWEKENLPKGQTIETAGLDPIQKEAVIAEAAAHANKVLLDYSKVNNFVSGARQYYLGAPFLTYIYKTFPVMVENMAKRPVVASKYLIVFPYLMASLVMNAFDWDDDDFDKYMARLGDRARDSSTFTLLPFKDDNGDIQAVDFDYMFPLAPYFNAFNHIRNGVSLDSTTDFLASSAKVSHDLLYRDLGFLSGPIPQTISMLLNNEDTFTGKPVWTEGAPASQNIYEVVTHLASIMMPPWATETGVINKTLKAFNHYKKYDLSSEQFTPTQAFASGVGFNLRDAVDTEGFRIKMLQLQKKIRNTKSARVKRLREARRRGLSNQEIATINRQYAEEIKKTQKEISEFSKLIR